MEISGEIIYKLKSKCFLVSSLSIYAFSTHYTILYHDITKKKLRIIKLNTILMGRGYFIRLEMSYRLF